ncbi:hypothetical protein EJ110_NYTH31468 [Nymphaea thermarum]|nr:hypothetical protein EJ110_NYTH31468 [Nymphaea thermarum]
MSFLFVQMEYHRKGKKRAGPSTEAQRKPSPAHSDAHTPLDDSSSGHQYAQLGGGAQTSLRQTPPVDQQTILLTTLQTLSSLVQSMVSNQRSNVSPSEDTTAPLKGKAPAVSFQQFMAMQPPIFSGGCSHDQAKHWIEEIERFFVLLRMPEEDKVNYGTYLLKGDALDWWKSTLEIRFAGQLSLSWMQFRDSFFSTYYPVHARDKKMQEFLDLQQNQLNLEEYITRYRHLETYCPHFYSTDGARACKFVRGMREGLRSKVLSSRPRDLDEAVTMARCIEEDWVRTQKDHQKKAGQHSQGGRTQVKRQHFAGRTRPYERRDDRTFRRNQPTPWQPYFCDENKASMTALIRHPLMEELVMKQKEDPELAKNMEESKKPGSLWHQDEDGSLRFRQRLWVPRDEGVKHLLLDEAHICLLRRCRRRSSHRPFLFSVLVQETPRRTTKEKGKGEGGALVSGSLRVKVGFGSGP